MLIKRVPWRAQPAAIARINSGPSFVWSPTQGNTREAISGAIPASYAASGAQAVEPGPAGIAARGGSSRASRWNANQFRTSTDYTLLAVVLDDTGRSTNRNPFDSDDTGSARVFQFRVDSGNKLSFIPFNTAGSNWPVTGATNTPSDRPIVIAARAQNNNLSVWLDGKRDGTSTASGTLRTLQTSGALLSIGATAASSYTQGFGGQIYLCVYYPYALSDAELQSIPTPGAAFGFVFAPRSIWVPVSDAGGSVTGTSATTNANDTSTASGTTTVVGTSATTNANDTATASGSVGGAVTGTSATTNANDTSSATGTTTVTGTVAYSNANDSAAASGWSGSVSGTAEVANANDTAQASGTAAGGATDTHDGFWSREWAKLKKREEKKPTIAEVVEIVKESPQVMEVVREEVERKYPQVDYAEVRQNIALQRFIARQLIEAAQEEDDIETLLLMA